MNIPPAGNENRLDVERSHHGSRASKRYMQVVFRTGAQATMVKNALTEELASVAHLKKSLDVEANTCYTDKRQEISLHSLWLLCSCNAGLYHCFAKL